MGQLHRARLADDMHLRVSANRPAAIRDAIAQLEARDVCANRIYHTGGFQTQTVRQRVFVEAAPVIRVDEIHADRFVAHAHFVCARLLRFDIGEFENVDQIAGTVITTVDGAPVRVRDVAAVDFGYQDIGRYTEIGGVPAIRIAVRKQTEANTIEVARRVIDEVERINTPRSDLELTVINDTSDFIKGSIASVRNSALWGGILAVIVLLAFLRNVSATIIVAVAIPISIIATFGLIYFNALTLNQMSFGGIALGVGLIVDNSIVVLENIFRQRQRGLSAESSALIGTRQVTGAMGYLF